VSSLVSAMSELLGNDERRQRFGQQSRRAAVEHFDWATLAATLSEGLAPYDHFKPASR